MSSPSGGRPMADLTPQAARVRVVSGAIGDRQPSRYDGFTRSLLEAALHNDCAALPAKDATTA